MKDEEAKRRLGYKEKNSLVRPDGSEKLVGRDWKQRKHELWLRCGMRCEQVVSEVVCSRGEVLIPAERCRSEAHDPHHIKPRSKGRDDRMSNLIALCRMHHELVDWKKLKGKNG